MVHYKEVQEIRKGEELISKECDKCHKIFYPYDIFEIGEFLHFRNVGGYGSVFGDGTKIELDLCQHCVKEILGLYLRVGPDWLEKVK